ncbi:MAG: rhodanese-like domain-containing protein [Stappiaceae bacterium]
MTTADLSTSRKDRRHFIRLAFVSSIATLINPNIAFAKSQTFNGRMSAPDVYALSERDVVQLIDIRRPEEWQQTGTGNGAHKISMHEAGFVARIDTLLEGDRTKPVALICARGNRSRRMKVLLNEAGFTNVVNVSEGMLGSDSGVGWLKRKLPLN